MEGTGRGVAFVSFGRVVNVTNGIDVCELQPKLAELVPGLTRRFLSDT
jgi:hypothetical protein